MKSQSVIQPEVGQSGDSLHGIVRHNFERWISGPPFEYSIERFPENPSIFGWPGNYKNVAVDLAWAAWLDAWSENARLRQLLETSDRLLFGFGLGNNSPHRQAIADILSNVRRHRHRTAGATNARERSDQHSA